MKRCVFILILILSLCLCACAQEAEPPAAVFDKVYAFDGCLYMAPYSSYYPFEGTGQLYRIERGCLTILDQANGEALETHGTDTPSYAKVKAEGWEKMFAGFAPVDISAYRETYQYAIADDYRLYLMDGEVWLGRLGKDGALWSLYKLKVDK